MRALLREFERFVKRLNRRNRNPAYFDLLQDLRRADPGNRHRAWFLHERIIRVLEGEGGSLTPGQRAYLNRLRRQWQPRADISGLLRSKLKALGLDVSVGADNG